MRGRPTNPILCLAFFAAVRAAPGALPDQAHWGQKILSIRLDADAHLTLADFQDRLAVRIGEPLRRPDVAETLKNLFASGRFAELRADAETKDEGVDLVLVARAAFFVGAVRVEGVPEPMDPKVLTGASRLRLGQLLSEDSLAEASKRLAAVLRDSGYYEARVQHRLAKDLDTQEADVVFSISPGRPARLARVEFEGHPIFPPETLARIAGWRTGRHLTSAEIERGLAKLHRFYASRGQIQAIVEVRKRGYDPRSGTETLTVDIEAGVVVRVRVIGARISNSKVKELLPFFRDGILDEEGLLRGARALEDYFQRQGYFQASAEVSRNDRPGPPQIEITCRVKRGPFGEFRGYSFEGNHAVRTAELIAALSQEGGPLPSRTFSRALLARNVRGLEEFYRARGFLEAKVTPLVRRQTHSQPEQLFVTFKLEEGERTHVRHLAIRGLEPQLANELRPLLVSQPSAPYSSELAEADQHRILTYFSERGYTRAQTIWQGIPVSPDHQVDLEFHVEPGPQERIKRVVIMGNARTRSGVIRRELALREGEPLRHSDVLESQRRLYDLGIFNQVEITRQDTQSPEANSTVLVSVEEARRWTVGYGGGIEVQRLGSDQPQGQLRASPRLSLELTRLNVGGRPQTFTLHGRFSSLQKGGGLSYLVPRLLTRRDLTLRISGLVDRSRDVLTFTADRREASVSIEKRFSPGALIVGRYTFRRVEALDISDRISPEQIPLVSRPARVGALGVSYVNDQRDDPADATRGSYSVADMSVAWRGFGSEASFFRISGLNSTYWRIGSRLIFARNTRVGIEEPLGGPSGSLLAPQIPLPERFFMGGSESHRGFSINQAGPRDLVTGFPIGGNALFFNAFELRIPFPEKRLGFVLFEDAGDVFSSIRRTRLLKVRQSSPTDFDYTVHAVGLGLRYKTRLAPVRFDLGYSLNAPRFQVQSGGGLEIRRLPRFQFFLSIGQSF